jgi:hypothetical protein
MPFLRFKISMKGLQWILMVVILAGWSLPAIAQDSDIGFFFGASNYNGDLQPAAYTFFESHPALSLMYWRELNGHFNVRGGFSLAQISADDRYNPKPSTKVRNLSFHSNITEFQGAVEYSLANMYVHRFSPYIFGGLALFHFNPTAVDTTGKRVFLKPLSTEGEGLPQYPGAKPYSLTQLAIPIGGGIRYQLTDALTVGVEIGLRVTFTDYLDDASTVYVDPNILLAAKGPEAVEMSFRTNELPQYKLLPYPAPGTQRASAASKDFYYFSQITIAYRLFSSRSHSPRDRGAGLDKAERAVQCPPVKGKK